MSAKQIEVTCPCCETHLVVDVRTQQILRSAPPSEDGGTAKPDASRWDSAQSRVQERTEGVEDKLTQALGKEQDRRKSFEDRFREAQDRALRKPGEGDEEEEPGV